MLVVKANFRILVSSFLTAALIGFSIAADFQYRSKADIVYDSGNRTRGVQNRDESDILLGGLFPIHTDAAEGSACGSIRLERGIERMEAMLYALDLVNNDSTLLPGLKVGFDIRDTCNSENIGLDESVDLVVAGNLVELESCTAQNVGDSNNASSATAAPTSAVIGAASSAVTVPVATLLRLFKIPQVSYASSSALLNNRDRYSFFFRTISSDNLQAEAMVDLCLKYGWRYVSTIYQNNFYGELGIDEFRTLAQSSGMCIDVDQGIDVDFKEDDYRTLAEKLLNSTAEVVVLFASHTVAEELFKHLNETSAILNKPRRFLWIASDAWARSGNVVKMFNESLAGLFGIAPQTEFQSGFQEYFSQLTPETNLRNPWFNEFYEAVFQCGGNGTNQCKPPYKSITEHQGYKQGNFIPLVVDAVYSVVHAINNFLQQNCEQPLHWYHSNHTCKGQNNNSSFNGETILKYLMNVSFLSPTGRNVSFDSNGNPKENVYEILNYQLLSNSNYDFVSIGHWASTTGEERGLKINESNRIQFGLHENGSVIYKRESQCQFCQQGQRRRPVVGSCCGTCDGCLGQEFSNSTTAEECSRCPNGRWGNSPLTGSTKCVPISEDYLSYSNPWAIVLIIMALLGLAAVVFVYVVMLFRWNTPIIKSSGREQMTVLLVGITLCFLWTFLFVAKPSIAICFFQRLGLWLCFSFILGALLVKLIRIARIFLRSPSSPRPKFTGPIYQILFTFAVVAFQMLLLLISFSVAPPKTTTTTPHDSHNFPTSIITCSPPHTAPLVFLILYDTVLVLACNVLAILTIRFPNNFNEARYVSFSTFAVGLIWVSFLLTYATTERILQTAAISFALNLSAFAVLGCLFGPRIFIIIFLPDRNTEELSKITSSPQSILGSMRRVSSDLNYTSSIRMQIPTRKISSK